MMLYKPILFPHLSGFGILDILLHDGEPPTILKIVFLFIMPIHLSGAIYFG